MTIRKGPAITLANYDGRSRECLAHAESLTLAESLAHAEISGSSDVQE